MVVKIITADAQWALDRLVARYGEFLASRQTTAGGRRNSGRHGSNVEAIELGNAIVDLIAIAEAFSVSRLISINSSVDEEKELGTWANRKKAWLRFEHVDLNSFSRWSALMGFVEARNALQHGLGKLTNRQLGKRKEEIFRDLRAAAVRRNGDVLIIERSDVSRASEVCRDFIEWLDVEAPDPRMR